MRRQLGFPLSTSYLLHPRCQTAVRLSSQRNRQTVRYSHNGPAQPSDSTLVSTGRTSAPSSPGSTRPYATFKVAMPLAEAPEPQKPPSLSILPLTTVLRSLFVTTVSSSPILFGPSLAFLSVLANSESPLLSPDQNPVLKFFLGQTLYAQFCAGETPEEVKGNVSELKKLGFSGVILGYAREYVMDDKEINSLSQGDPAKDEDTAKTAVDIASWKKGTLATVDLADDGDFVALKFTGAGKGTVQRLLHRLSPSPALQEAMVEICERSKARNVRLLIDAEQQAVQPAIDDWALEFQRRYNKGLGQRAVVYGTYQGYLRSTPATLSRHIAISDAEGFVLGVKLVRGAYLGTESRHIVWDTKQDTDKTYDAIAESLIRRQYGEVLQPHRSSADSDYHRPFPKVDLVLASHNRVSVERARKIQEDEQLRNTGARQINMAYGQLQGMADNISCELVQMGKLARDQQAEGVLVEMEPPKAYKYLVWGTVGECTRYLLRRAQENRDAASRTEDTRKAMAQELRRRLMGG
ncbi:hypothetical protein AJ79_09042 [Helicocarpus griseus UAMH5409]|uniref:Proline dehydrogenase n=1 Tax=Helicocarpus griseus UAMH5409 TaxID=1447875 RepID=A0A2B7WN00_9EURO|nr:hypothetical protein AJ79_09042 [Helicocarpus griseus UAMH5409]